jgi:hypothetical protein
MRKWLVVLTVALFAVLLVAAPALAAPTRSHDAVNTKAPGTRTPGPELATPPYSLYTYYSDLGAILKDIDRRSKRVTVVQTGKSAAGQPMWNVIVTWPMTKKQKQMTEYYRELLLTDPGAVLRNNWLQKSQKHLRPATFINCSIHGGETTGVDAGLLLLERLAFQNDAQTKKVLKSLVVVINPVQNPDGRVTDLRQNNNGFDCNRDFIQLSQPETQQTQNAVQKWLPLSFTDLHGYVNPMLIEPCTIPHNPSLEYDLFIKHALKMARQQRDFLEQTTGATGQIPYLWGTAEDLLDGVNEGWDDYGPYYTPMMAQYYGSTGQTIEVAFKSNDGVRQHYAIIWTTVAHDAKYRLAKMKDQATIFYRGDANVSSAKTGRPWTGNMADMLRPVPYYLPDGTVNPAFPYSDKVGDLTFPYAYIIPVHPALQKDVLEAYKAVNHARGFGVEVHKAKSSFAYGGITYPKGTYVVKLQQPLRGMANNLFWLGEDVKARYGVNSMYDVSVWQLPELWGFDRVVATDKFTASLGMVTKEQARTGKITGDGPIFWFEGDNNWAVRAVNGMIARGIPAGMVSRQIAAPFDTVPLGTFVVDASQKWGKDYVKWVAANWGVDFTEIDGLQMAQVSAFPASIAGQGTIDRPKVMVNVDAQLIWALKNVCGFNSNPRNGMGVVSATAPSGNGTFISSGNVATATINTWLAGDDGAVRRTYVGFGSGAGANAVALMPAGTTFAADPVGADNGACPVTVTTSIATAGYEAKDYVFAYPARWFEASDPAVQTGMTWTGTTGGVYESGFWRDPANSSAGAGKAAMVTYEPADHGRIWLMGFHPGYRAQMENTYLLLARAIFLSVATPPSVP